MNDYDRTATAIRQANPWAEGGVASDGEWSTAELLSQIEHRSGTVKTIERRTTTQRTGPGRNRRFLVAGAVAVAVVMVVVIAAAFIGPTDDSAPDVGGPPTTGPSEAEARQNIDQAFAAFNAGDLQTWYEWRELGPVEVDDLEYAQAAAGRFDVGACTYRGASDWLNDFGVVSGQGFECPVTYTDDLIGAAGIELEMTYTWIIGAGPISSVAGSNEDGEAWNRFFRQFRDWLAVAHPEVEAAMEFDGSEPLPASVATALAYVDEFVAQSDVYPLAEPVPERGENSLRELASSG